MTDPQSTADQQDAQETQSAQPVTPQPALDVDDSAADKQDANEFESSN